MIENLQYSNGTGGVIISRDQPLKVACSEPTGASFDPRPGDVGAMRLSIREVGPMSADLTDLQEAPARTDETQASAEAKNAHPTGRTAGKANEAPEASPPRPDELWHCRQEAWATLPNGWNFPVQSPEFRHWLVGECVRLRQSSKKARIDALLEVYTAVALYEGLEHQLHLRRRRTAMAVSTST